MFSRFIKHLYNAIVFNFTVNPRITSKDTNKKVNVKNQNLTMTMRYLIKFQCLFFTDSISQLYILIISRLCTEIINFFFNYNFYYFK